MAFAAFLVVMVTVNEPLGGRRVVDIGYLYPNISKRWYVYCICDRIG
jgi:hypothetical protein